MKWIFLRFCYAVEIGAYLAYVGHYKKSKDSVVKKIKRQELEHMVHIKTILRDANKKPYMPFNIFFFLIGSTIKYLCAISPLLILDGIAQIMEVFNIISYDILVNRFPEYKGIFNKMEKQESEHEKYFSTFPKYGRKK